MSILLQVFFYLYTMRLEDGSFFCLGTTNASSEINAHVHEITPD